MDSPVPQEIKPRRGGYRPGAGRPVGTGKPLGRDHKAIAKAALIEKLLLDHAAGKLKGKKRLDPSRVTALRAVYDKYKPTLAAVEHTDTDPRDIGTPAEFFGKVVAILAANPALHERLNREVLAAREQQLDGAEMGKALELVIMSNTSDVVSEPQAQRVEGQVATYPSTTSTACSQRDPDAI